ncbi:hypothetical protein, partial [Umezakia ovalisporum]|uniref:hypothetical protein n=1 Tax=Umezakia ovalisporum TaxID=75695 RepID=UPI0039C639AA
MKKALYLSLFVILLSTCKKDTSLPEPENFYYYLTKEQLNKTPYFTNPKFDTLTFISNKSDT